MKSSKILKLKARTLLVGGGNPRAFKDGEKHFDGYVACQTLPELRKWIEKKEFEIAEHESKWQPVPKKKVTTKKFMASYGHGNCEGGCNHDDGYWSGFTRRGSNWP